MTINQAISQLDNSLPNPCSRADKIGWLARLDGQVKLFLERYGDCPDFIPYTTDTQPDTCLLVPAPFDEAYIRYMEAQLHYQNGEITRYNNAMSLLSSLLTAFYNHYNRKNMPRGDGFRYF